jgi:hypothetical protein
MFSNYMKILETFYHTAVFQKENLLHNAAVIMTCWFFSWVATYFAGYRPPTNRQNKASFAQCKGGHISVDTRYS